MRSSGRKPRGRHGESQRVPYRPPELGASREPLAGSGLARALESLAERHGGELGFGYETRRDPRGDALVHITGPR